MANEKRLIDANALIAYFEEQCKIAAKDSAIESLYTLAALKCCIDYFERVPTVDAVEVVRCKDCRWARPQDHREPVETPAHTLICECFMHHHIPAPWGARLAVKSDDFCSYGERRYSGYLFC